MIATVDLLDLSHLACLMHGDELLRVEAAIWSPLRWLFTSLVGRRR